MALGVLLRKTPCWEGGVTGGDPCRGGGGVQCPEQGGDPSLLDFMRLLWLSWSVSENVRHNNRLRFPSIPPIISLCFYKVYVILFFPLY
jgi:hypothetical protein